jgi:hypothetical protein
MLAEKDFKVDDNEYYRVEMCPVVDTKTPIDEEELYDVYKRIRDEGYIWNDPDTKNLGRIIHSFEYNNHMYESGSIVVFDLEDFAYVGEVTSDEILEEIAIASYNSRTYRFETRYINEKSKKKVIKGGI